VSEVAKRRGRPPSTELPFSREIADSICERLANGESLIAIWQDKDPEFHSAYARARELQAEHFVDEILLIADDGRKDFMERARQNGETFVDANREHLERSKIRISTRQWIIERILASKYGPKP
jgi:Bacteriophage Sf6, terminase small subunit-like